MGAKCYQISYVSPEIARLVSFIQRWSIAGVDYTLNVINFLNSGSEEAEEPRPTYWGEKRTSPITGQQEYYYPPWKRKVKTYGVSYPIVLLCMKTATVIVLLYFRFLDAIETRYANASGIVATIMLLLPSIIYAVVIAVMNNLYLKLATFLTEWGEYGNKKSGCV